MDTPIQKQNDQTDTIDMVLDLLPEGVEEFMWSTQYDELVDGIKKTLSLTDEQTELVKTKGRELLARLKELPDVAQELLASGISKELTAKILYLLDEGILQPVAVVVAEQNQPTEEKREGNNIARQVQPTPVQGDTFSLLKEKLTIATKIAPTTSPTPPPPTSTTQPLRIDPYREIPEK